jgi:hypothetical protein
MKKIYKTFFLVLFMSFTNKEFAQSKESKEPTSLFRVYEDNDFLNINGHGTDKSYSDGTRLDFFYQKKNKSHFFLDKLMPMAGDSSNNIYGWSLMQIMVTPNDISAKKYQPNDYAYAGALFALHSLYSYNAQKKYSFQTEFLAGVRGPASFGKAGTKRISRAYQLSKAHGLGQSAAQHAAYKHKFHGRKTILICRQLYGN